MLRDHLGDHPRSPIDVWLDDGTLNAFRVAARVHASLLPYLYSLAAEASRTGLPIMRYLPMEAPDDPRAWQEEQSLFPRAALSGRAGGRARRDDAHRVPAAGRVGRLLARDDLHAAARRSPSRRRSTGAARPSLPAPGAVIPLAPEYDSLVAAPAASDVRTWIGDLIVRVMPSGPAGSRQSSFTLYDGTRLQWDRFAARGRSNPRPRSIELRKPDGSVVVQQVEGQSAQLS